MIRQIKLLAVFVFLFSACTDDTTISTIHFTHKKDIVLKINNFIYNQPRDFEIVDTDEGKILFYYMRSRFSAYNLDTETFLFQELKAPNFIRGAKFINNDSIFIQLREAADVSSDSTLFFTDYQGNIFSYLPLTGMPVRAVGSNWQSIDSIGYIESSTIMPDNTIILQFAKFKFDEIHDTDWNKVTIPLIGKINPQTNKFAAFDITELPALEKDQQYLRDYMIPVKLTPYKNSVLCSFWYTPFVYQYHLDTETNNELFIPSVFAKDSFISIPKHNNIRPVSFSDFLLWEEENLLLRQVYFKHSGQNVAVILDENMNTIGEAVLPKGRLTYWYGNELYVFNTEKTYANDGTIVFSVYEAELAETTKEDYIANNQWIATPELIEEVPETCPATEATSAAGNDIKRLKNYLVEKTGKETFRAFIVPAKACPSCIDYILTNYHVNEATFEALGIYLVVVGQNTPQIKQKLRDFKIAPASPMVFTDQPELYQQTLKDFYNQHILLVDSNKITMYKNYTADSLDTIVMDIIQGTDYVVE